MGVGHVLLPPVGPKSVVLGMLSRNKGRSFAGQASILITSWLPPPDPISGNSAFQQLADECVRCAREGDCCIARAMSSSKQHMGVNLPCQCFSTLVEMRGENDMSISPAMTSHWE